MLSARTLHFHVIINQLLSQQQSVHHLVYGSAMNTFNKAG